MARLQEALRSLRTLRLLGDIGRSGGSLTSVADLVDNFADSRQMALCLERFLALPGGPELLALAPPPLQLDLDALAELPRGTLGHSVAAVLLRLGYDPDFARPRPVATPEQWLIQRLATTHDIHHVVSGFATLGEGENGVLAITAVQIGFPAFVILNTAAAFGSFRFQPERYALVSQAIARGTAMGLASAPFCVQRWEEGWERPLADWRRELGVLHPLQEEPYAMRRMLDDLDAEL